MTTLYLAADHAGFKLKERLKPRLQRLGFAVRDLTPRYAPNDDYPPIGRDLARKTVKDKTRGILVCGSGVGVAIAANRVPGARAVEGQDAAQIRLARQHNDVNVLTLSGWKTPLATALKLIRIFLNTNASSAPRHRRRIKQLG